MTKHSFSLPKYSAAMQRLYQEIKGGLQQQDELLGKIQTQAVSHGGITRQVSEPVIVDTRMQRFEAMFEIKLEAFLHTNVEQFIESIVAMIESFHSQQKKYL